VNYSFPKTSRLRKRRQFQRLSYGKRHAGNWIVLESRENNQGVIRLGITVTKRYGKAHDRNRFKRIVREAFRRCQGELQAGLDINVKPRLNAKEAKPSDIQEDLMQLFGAANERGS
jgi:ribonuclease P protein component